MPIFQQVADLIEQSLSQERAGDIGKAFQLARQALELGRAAGDKETLASALVCEAYIQFRTGSFDQAQSLADEALKLTTTGTAVYVDALLVLGICACETDNLDKGEEYYRTAIDVSRQLGDKRRLFRGLHNLSSEVYLSRGQFDLALAAAEEAFRIADLPELHDWAWLPICNIARISYITGNLPRARQNLEILAPIARPGSLAEGFMYCARANLSLEEGDLELALPLYDKARSIGEAIGDLGLNIDVRLGLSRDHLALGNVSTAFAWADDALKIGRRAHAHYSQVMALIELGQAAWELGDISSVEASFREAMAIAASLKDHFDLTRARLLLAAVLYAQKKPEAQPLWVESARAILNHGYAFLLDRERGRVFPMALDFMQNLGAATGNSQTIGELEEALNYIESQPPPYLNVRLMGTFLVRQGGRRISDEAWHRPIVRRLFIYFVLHRGETLPRDQILEELWPEADPAGAAATFNTVQSRLRHILDPFLRPKKSCRYFVIDENTYLFDPDHRVHTDLDLFLAQTRRIIAQPAGNFSGQKLPPDFIQALNDWQPLLPGLAYEDWLVDGREMVQGCYLEGCLFAAQVYLTQGSPVEAVGWAKRAVRAAPWLEEGYQVLMRAYACSGERSRALKVYEEATNVLKRELDVVPSKLTVTLYERIRGDQPV